jgi:hypothetical protein
MKMVSGITLSERLTDPLIGRYTRRATGVRMLGSCVTVHRREGLWFLVEVQRRVVSAQAQIVRQWAGKRYAGRLIERIDNTLSICSWIIVKNELDRSPRTTSTRDGSLCCVRGA